MKYPSSSSNLNNSSIISDVKDNPMNTTLGLPNRMIKDWKVYAFFVSVLILMINMISTYSYPNDMKFMLGIALVALLLPVATYLAMLTINNNDSNWFIFILSVGLSIVAYSLIVGILLPIITGAVYTSKQKQIEDNMKKNLGSLQNIFNILVLISAIGYFVIIFMLKSEYGKK